MQEFNRIISCHVTVFIQTHLIAKRLKTSESNFYPKALSLFNSMHVNKLLIFFVFATKHRFNSLVLGIIHYRSLTIVTATELVKA